jgi:hypothetical protein
LMSEIHISSSSTLELRAIVALFDKYLSYSLSGSQSKSSEFLLPTNDPASIVLLFQGLLLALPCANYVKT